MRMTWVVLIGMVALLTAGPARATVFRSGSTTTVEEGEVINDDLIVSGDDLRIAGRVNGDVIAAGNTVRVTGPVTGSVMAAGSEVEVSGKVTGSVRAAGGKVVLRGPVGRNAALAGGEVTFAREGRVARDLHAAGGTLKLDGSVLRSLTAAGGRAELGGSVGGGVSFEGNALSLSPTARIAQGLTYRTPQAAAIAAGATIGGTVRHLLPRPRKAQTGALSWWLALLTLLTGYVFGLVGLAVLPRVFLAAGYAMYSRPWWNLLLGLLVLIVGPGVVLLLLITVVGLPLGLFLLLLWLFLILLAGLPVGLFVGDFLLTRTTHHRASPYLALFLGLLVLVLLSLIPYFALLVRALVVLFGLGVYARAIKGALAELRRSPAARAAV